MSSASNPGTSQLLPEEEICLVCNDHSTGYHYGVPSCNGCKTFFRRTIMKKQVFKCQYNGNCNVDKSIRCACRFCRFEKCIKVGMDPKAIQQNRDPIGYTKRTRRYPPIKNVSTSSNSSSLLSPGNPHSVETHSPQESVMEIKTEQMLEDFLFHRLCTVEVHVEKLRNSYFVMQKSLVEAVVSPSVFLDQEFLETCLEPTHKYDAVRPAKMADHIYWHEREWVIMIEWSKTLPVYEGLEIDDKLAMLRSSSITYPALLQCFYTPNKGPDTIIFPNGAYFDRSPETDRPSGYQRKKLQMLDCLLRPFRELDIDVNEFAAAKAIFFLNPEFVDADDLRAEVRNKIADNRMAISNALYRYMIQKRGSSEGAEAFGRLLLLGTVVATMAVEMKETVMIADFFGQVKYSSFAKELLFGVLIE